MWRALKFSCNPFLRRDKRAGPDRMVSSDSGTDRVAIKTEGVRNFTLATHGACQHSRRRGLTCVQTLVDLQVLRPSKLLSTAGERAGEGLLSSVHPHMVDQLVLGLERPLLP